MNTKHLKGSDLGATRDFNNFIIKHAYNYEDNVQLRIYCSDVLLGYTNFAKLNNMSGMIFYIETHPMFRRRGIMRKFLPHIFSNLKRKGVKFVGGISDLNKIPIWISMGFEDVDLELIDNRNESRLILISINLFKNIDGEEILPESVEDPRGAMTFSREYSDLVKINELLAQNGGKF